MGQSIAEIRSDRVLMAAVRRYTRATLPIVCESALGAHRAVYEEADGDWYCGVCGRMFVGAGAKRERRIRWQDGRRSELRQIQMAI